MDKNTKVRAIEILFKLIHFVQWEGETKDNPLITLRVPHFPLQPQLKVYKSWVKVPLT